MTRMTTTLMMTTSTTTKISKSTVIVEGLVLKGTVG